MKLFIREITFSAAHYLLDHPECGTPHGHTYFIKDLIIVAEPDKRGIIIDFGELKSYFEHHWDHMFIVPNLHFEHWYNLYQKLGFDTWRLRASPNPTVENYAKSIKKDLMRSFQNIKWLSFKLLEGPKQGVCVESE